MTDKLPNSIVNEEFHVFMHSNVTWEDAEALNSTRENPTALAFCVRKLLRRAFLAGIHTAEQHDKERE